MQLPGSTNLVSTPQEVNIDSPNAIATEDPLIEGIDLFCERDDRVLFENLCFSIPRGSITQIEGPNGAGKTTLLRIIAGLSQIYEGELKWCGESISDARVAFASNLLYLGHKPGVKSLLTPRENLRALSRLRRTVTETDIDNALEKVGLYGFEDVPCHSLSAGQHRRVGLARLYISDEPLWILDEAFTAIDKKGVAELENLFAERARLGGTIVLTTHHELRLDVPFQRIVLGQRSGGQNPLQAHGG
ncbi:MAG: cytochrome c biogenesis heme-transporting ATPase CcmA [Pseudomonadales bacterium]|nr:cytochrome c biogenesis heme-transporting ATPase CcmA [Pseudomonadales bacterium]